jgi:hypothetical protein
MIKTSSYTFTGYRETPYTIKIMWDTIPEEDGIFPILALDGQFVAVQHFQNSVVNVPAFRKVLNDWLKTQTDK